MGDFDFINYFLSISWKLTELHHSATNHHFSRVSSVAELGEFLANMRQAEGYQLIVVDNISGRFLDRRSDNLLIMPYFSFYVVKQATREDYDSKEEAIGGCVTVVKKILSKMFKDKREMLNGLTNLDRDSISYNQAGPFGHNWYGVNVNFTIIDDVDIVYSEADWTR